MAGSALLDTNAAIALIASDASIASALSGLETLILPVTALGELFHGAYNSNRVSENLSRLAMLTSRVVVVPCTDAIADVYGQLKTDLRGKGRPIPENDIWIAAIAIHHGLPLVSRDAHFDAVDGLTRISW